MGWIGVDLDGTLAMYNGWVHGYIGPPIPAMLERVKDWIASGKEVRIMTARAGDEDQILLIADWLERHGIGGLAITNTKDYAMEVLYDDRAVTVEMNTGRILTRGY